jgi:hypothetical protein|nr:MAG TPA: hypothetical protein [Caudoviricetes sp.]
MGKIGIPGGGGGVTSDDVTAGRDQVLQGFKTITSDSDDEVVDGSLTSMPSQVDALSWRFDGDNAYLKIPQGAYVAGGGAEVKLPFAWVRPYIPEGGMINTSGAFGKQGTIPDRGAGNGNGEIGTNGGDTVFVNFPDGYYHTQIGKSYMWLKWADLARVLGLNGAYWLDNYSAAGIQGQIRRWVCTTGTVISAWNGEGHAWDDTEAGRGRGLITRVPNGYRLEGVNWVFLPAPHLYPQNVVKGVNINGVEGSRDYIDSIAPTYFTGDYTYHVNSSEQSVTMNVQFGEYNTVIVGVDLVGQEVAESFFRFDKGGRCQITTLALTKNTEVFTVVKVRGGNTYQFTFMRDGSQLKVRYLGSVGDVTLNVYVIAVSSMQL